LLPAAPFEEPRINAPEPVCQSFPTGACSSKRLFTNPQRLPVAEPPFRVRTLPACFFAAPLSFAPDPFGLPLLHSNSVCPSRSEFYATYPLPSSQPNCLLRPTDLRSPLGFLGPSGSKRSTDLPFEKLTLVLDPIPLRSPPALRFISLPADQRSRIATAHQVCCPLNLLEPST
jgi:hypothetical protein